MGCLGCSATDDADDGSATTTTTAATTGAGDTAMPSTSGADTGSTGAAGDGILQCVESCTVPADCCTPNTACPGPYPGNPDCVDGLCVAPRCLDDGDCAGLGAGGACRDVAGHPSCVLPCADDRTCAGAQLGSCASTDDLGGSYCLLRCDAPGEFCGNQTCDATSGLCICATDGQCQSDWRCVE